MNSVVNARIERTLRSPVFVPPYPSDEGQALGNAIYGYLQQVRMLDSPCANRQSFSDFTYLGGEYGDAEITAALSGLSRDRWRWSRREQLGREVAELLASGAVVGWFQGRSEYGARALGNRSVLGDPRSVELRDRINRLKGRELFRPLAPAVLAERAADFFESADSLLLPHMLGAVWVRPEKIDSIRGAVHVDNTARAQVVRREHNPRFHDLIREFDGLSGVPMVINTSFNAAGDPIVESPDDAIEACEKMNLDGLAIGSYLVTRMGPPAG